ncbi:MAG TPA: hypothetical protein GXX38_09710 [Clostridia bacterium]|jgi:hypothetical protein|nr:hypothetical protein [Clostridia bacterium]
MRDNYEDVTPELRDFLRMNWEYEYEEVYVLYPRKTGRQFLIKHLLGLLDYFEKMRWVTVFTKDEEVYFPRIVTEEEIEEFKNFIQEHAAEIKDVTGICWDLNRFRVSTRQLVLMAVDFFDHGAAAWVEEQLNLNVPIMITFEYGTFFGTMLLKYNEFLFRKLMKLSVEPTREPGHFLRAFELPSQERLIKVVWSYWQDRPLKREDAFYRKLFDLINQGDLDLIEVLSAYCQGRKKFEQYKPHTPEGEMLKNCLSFGD